MLEFLTGTGLATSAGLNAYIPLLALGLLDRFTGLVDLPAGWTWLSADASLWILGALLALELVADKIPGVDAVNDVVQTVVRPAAGGIVFASGVGAEDVSAAGLVAAALFLPVLVAVLVVAVVVGLWLLARRFRARQTRGRAAAAPGGPEWTA